ncbi:MAG: hypothetical protein KIS29_10505 [Thermoplasmata archaeon]|nr:hypothetical protein [Candidatus Sysuiplasma jiujiangense]
MKELKKKPLTGKDREKYIHGLRESEGRVTWTNHKVRFGAQDILGCIDTISYSPFDIYLDQTSTVNHMSHKRAEIVRMLKDAPETINVVVMVHGVDGYRLGNEKVITRYVRETWLEDGSWEREQIYPPESIRSPGRQLKPKEGVITPKMIKPTKPRRR